MPHLGRMHAKFLGNFVYRLDSSDRIHRNLSFELTAEILTTFFAHDLLLFIAGYHLILLSGFWGPLYIGGFPSFQTIQNIVTFDFYILNHKIVIAV